MRKLFLICLFILLTVSSAYSQTKPFTVQFGISGTTTAASGVSTFNFISAPPDFVSGASTIRGLEYTDANAYLQLSNITIASGLLGTKPGAACSGTTITVYFWESLLDDVTAWTAAGVSKTAIGTFTVSSGTSRNPVQFYPRALGFLRLGFVSGVTPISGVSGTVRFK